MTPPSHDTFAACVGIDQPATGAGRLDHALARCTPGRAARGGAVFGGKGRLIFPIFELFCKLLIDACGYNVTFSFSRKLFIPSLTVGDIGWNFT
jgi:hypothetical protein